MAFNTHVKAYLDAGFLDLLPFDKIKIALTPDASDLLSQNGLNQANAILAEQLKLWEHKPWIAIWDGALIWANMSSILPMIHAYYLNNKGYVDKTLPGENPEAKLAKIVFHYLGQ